MVNIVICQGKPAAFLAQQHSSFRYLQGGHSTGSSYFAQANHPRPARRFISQHRQFCLHLCARPSSPLVSKRNKFSGFLPCFTPEAMVHCSRLCTCRTSHWCNVRSAKLCYWTSLWAQRLVSTRGEFAQAHLAIAPSTSTPTIQLVPFLALDFMMV